MNLIGFEMVGQNLLHIHQCGQSHFKQEVFAEDSGIVCTDFIEAYSGGGNTPNSFLQSCLSTAE